jgi:O-antigen ligase
MFAWMAFRTGSAKAVLALIAGAAAFLYAHLMLKFGKRYSVQVSLAFVAALVVVIASGDWLSLAQMLFDSEDLQGGRHFLYSEGFRMISSSPLFGRGPGAHVLDLGVYRDAHETLLTILLQAGVVGGVAFLLLLWRIGRRVMWDPALLGAFSTLLVYAAGGDIMRRTPAWIILFVIAHYPLSTDGISKTPVHAGVASYGG